MDLPPRWPEYFEREDELQEFALTAARCPDTCPKTNKRYTNQRWEKHWKQPKRQIDSKLTKDQILDQAGWDSFQQPVSPEERNNLNMDIGRTFEIVLDEFPPDRVRATVENLLGLVTVKEIARNLDAREERIRDDLREVRARLSVLLDDYRS